MKTSDGLRTRWCHSDDRMASVPTPPLSPSDVVTLACLAVLKGNSTQACHRWFREHWRDAFPTRPHRTRLFRQCTAHHAWSEHALATPKVLGVMTVYGVEFIHPIREGHHPAQRGTHGLSNHRWIVGGPWCLLLNQWELVIT